MKSCFIFLLLSIGIISASEHLSNIETVGNILEQKSKTIMQVLTGYQGKVVFIEAEGTHEANNVVMSYIQSILKKNGQPIKRVPQNKEPQGLTVNVKILDINVSYSNPRRRHFVGTRVVDRITKITLFLTLTAQDGKVLSSTKISGRRKDILPIDTAMSYQSSTYKFSNPKVPDTRSSILEPIVVTGIVGTLIYIFYANKEK